MIRIIKLEKFEIFIFILGKALKVTELVNCHRVKLIYQLDDDRLVQFMIRISIFIKEKRIVALKM